MPLSYSFLPPDFRHNKMRALIAITLVGSVSFAASINEDCKPHCMKDCLEVASGNVGSTDCLMMFGMGPEGKGWYWPEEGCGQIGKPEAGRKSRTCQESCELTCLNLCKPKRDHADGPVVADRYYGYGYRGYYG